MLSFFISRFVRTNDSFLNFWGATMKFPQKSFNWRVLISIFRRSVFGFVKKYAIALDIELDRIMKCNNVQYIRKFKRYIPTIILVKVFKCLNQVFFLLHLMAMHHGCGELDVIYGPAIVHVSLYTINQVILDKQNLTIRGKWGN